MTSNRQRNKLSRRLFSRLMSLKTSQMIIEGDPLGSRYAVNKFGLVVEHDDFHDLLRVYQAFQALLISEGWTIEPFSDGVKIHKRDEFEGQAFASAPWHMEHRPGNQGTFKISIGC